MDTSSEVETGSAITWKYPSCNLMGDHSIGEFYSVAVTKNKQQADTGTKMIHLGKNNIVAKGIAAGQSNNSYRGLVKIAAQAEHATVLNLLIFLNAIPYLWVMLVVPILFLT